VYVYDSCLTESANDDSLFNKGVSEVGTEWKGFVHIFKKKIKNKKTHKNKRKAKKKM